MTRPFETSSDIDRSEQRWWDDNSDLEEQFCWVQTPIVQRLLRRRYLRRALAGVRPRDSVLEIGCGTGWLTMLLAEMTGGAVVGVDFSAAQIARARQAAARAGAESRVRFVEGDIRASGVTGPFDVVVMHAFLHHLSTSEIRAVLTDAAGLLAGGGRLVVVEPVSATSGSVPPTRALRLLRRLARVPMSLQHRGLRTVGPEEIEMRHRLAERWRGDAPFGPSPKETPFAVGELEQLLGEQVRLDRVEPCLAEAHLVAQEMLLAQLSQPRLWRSVLPPAAALARSLDGRVLSAEPPPSSVWVFHLFLGTKSHRHQPDG